VLARAPKHLAATDVALGFHISPISWRRGSATELVKMNLQSIRSSAKRNQIRNGRIADSPGEGRLDRGSSTANSPLHPAALAIRPQRAVQCCKGFRRPGRSAARALQQGVMRVRPIARVGFRRFGLRSVGSLPAALVVSPSLREMTEKIVPVCSKAPAAMWHLLLRWA
jgi:hypothetical protein